MSKNIIVGIGEVLWDLFGTEKHLGGAPANFAYHANALGGRGIVVSRVGLDGLGDEILASLKRLGLTTEHVQRDARLPTGTVVVRLGRAGQPAFTITPNVAWDNIAATDTLMRLAGRADAVCFGTLAQRGVISRMSILRFLAAATKAIRVCDINLRAEFLKLRPRESERKRIVWQSIRAAHVLKLNADELSILRSAFGRAETEDALLRWLLRDFRLRLVCVTLGAKGCVLRTPRKRVEAPGVKVKVADTVGAGDAFTAAMVDGLLRNRRLEDVAEFANRLGAYVAARPGATPSLDEFSPDWPEPQTAR